MRRSTLNVVAVTGGRDFADGEYLIEIMDALHRERRIDVLVHGDATGADAIAKGWADSRAIQTCAFRVSKQQWDKIGFGAGPQRNEMMLEITRPNKLVAFTGGKGTRNCVEQARKMGIDVEDFRH